MYKFHYVHAFQDIFSSSLKEHGMIMLHLCLENCSHWMLICWQMVWQSYHSISSWIFQFLYFP